MKREKFSQLQIRELFHLEFLRWLGRKIKAEYYALKGGANLRFFFNSVRYSEDMDLDAHSIGVQELRDTVMEILRTPSFQENLITFGIAKVIPPNITVAKQVETTQRFKIHLITPSGEDLFTKIEFSRRGVRGRVVVQSVSDIILRVYKLPPLLVPHYDSQSAVMQKINALASRRVIQARDIFDLYTLGSQCDDIDMKLIAKDKLVSAYENIFKIGFEEFRDSAAAYLSIEDQDVYGNVSAWEEIKLKVANFVESLIKKYA